MKGKQFFALQFVTRSMPCITELRSLFYPNGVKIIPHNIYELLTPVALAHIIMGDGEAKSHGLIICTNNFSIQDVVRLMNVLILRYGLECTLRIKKYTAPLRGDVRRALRARVLLKLNI